MIKKFWRVFLVSFMTFCLSLSFLSEPAFAARTAMTGDYEKDTIEVAKVLKESVADPDSEEYISLSSEDTVLLITDYISRYRNRSQINQKVSFTTMQTALNALAGHYKTFPNRSVPETLKTRLEKELSKAETLVLKQS